AQLDRPSGVNITADSGTRLAGLADILPVAEPASGVGTAEHVPAGSADDAAVGGPEPVAPVLPASGWLDTPSEQAVEALPAEALVPEADPASGTGSGPPAGPETSDIFARGSAPVAAPADGGDVSDVIIATAY